MFKAPLLHDQKQIGQSNDAYSESLNEDDGFKAAISACLLVSLQRNRDSVNGVWYLTQPMVGWYCRMVG